MISTLTKLGLSEEESKVYIALLELGTGVASTVAKQAKIPRVNCYHHLENLITKGLVSSYEQNAVKHFTAESPETLVEQQKEKLGVAEGLIPQLLSLSHALAYKPKIRFVEGIEGIKALYNEVAQTKDELVGYTDLKHFAKLFPDFMKEYCARKVKNRVKMRMISPSSPEALSFAKDFYPKKFDQSLLEIFFVNPKEFPFENDIVIYENKVAIVSLNPKELIGVVIESPVYAKTEKAIFGLAWLGATAFVAK